MKEEQHQFLTVLGHPPARLSVDQVAWALGCQVHDIPILVAARMIKPLGNPAPNAIKFFATSEILEQAKDRSWLAKITNTVNQAWQKKNSRQKMNQKLALRNEEAIPVTLNKLGLDSGMSAM